MTAPKSYATARTCPISWQDLHRDSLILADRARARGPFAGVVAVARGGLVPAAVVAYALDLRRVETVAVASYDRRVQGAPHLVKPAAVSICGDGTGWLVVDDMVDSGITARAVRATLPGACLATVYAKPEGQASADLFAVAVPQDVWLLFPWEDPPGGERPIS